MTKENHTKGTKCSLVTQIRRRYLQTNVPLSVEELKSFSVPTPPSATSLSYVTGFEYAGNIESPPGSRIWH